MFDFIEILLYNKQKGDKWIVLLKFQKYFFLNY